MSKTANQKGNFIVRTSRTALGCFLILALGSAAAKAFGTSPGKKSMSLPAESQSALAVCKVDDLNDHSSPYPQSALPTRAPLLLPPTSAGTLFSHSDALVLTKPPAIHAGLDPPLQEKKPSSDPSLSMGMSSFSILLFPLTRGRRSGAPSTAQPLGVPATFGASSFLPAAAEPIPTFAFKIPNLQKTQL